MAFVKKNDSILTWFEHQKAALLWFSTVGGVIAQSPMNKSHSGRDSHLARLFCCAWGGFFVIQVSDGKLTLRVQGPK